MSLNLLLGVFCVGIGFLTLAARTFGWTHLIGKKEALEKRFGPTAGNAIHFLAYTALPIIAGVIFLNSELNFS